MPKIYQGHGHLTYTNQTEVDKTDTSRGAVFWDFDGVISDDRNEIVFSAENLEDSGGMVTAQVQCDNGFQDHYVVSDASFLKITLWILSAANIPSIIGSQRCVMSDSRSVAPTESIKKPHYQLTACYQALNELFGKKRPFLIEDKAEEAYAPLRDNIDLVSNTNHSKSSMVEAAAAAFNLDKDTVLVVDDTKEYGEDLAPDQFIHVVRDKDKYDPQESAYLIEVLFRKLPFSVIMKHLNEITPHLLGDKSGQIRVTEQDITRFKANIFFLEQDYLIQSYHELLLALLPAMKDLDSHIEEMISSTPQYNATNQDRDKNYLDELATLLSKCDDNGESKAEGFDDRIITDWPIECLSDFQGPALASWKRVFPKSKQPAQLPLAYLLLLTRNSGVRTGNKFRAFNSIPLTAMPTDGRTRIEMASTNLYVALRGRGASSEQSCEEQLEQSPILRAFFTLYQNIELVAITNQATKKALKAYKEELVQPESSEQSIDKSELDLSLIMKINNSVNLLKELDKAIDELNKTVHLTEKQHIIVLFQETLRANIYKCILDCIYVRTQLNVSARPRNDQSLLELEKNLGLSEEYQNALKRHYKSIYELKIVALKKPILLEIARIRASVLSQQMDISQALKSLEDEAQYIKYMDKLTTTLDQYEKYRSSRFRLKMSSACDVAVRSIRAMQQKMLSPSSANNSVIVKLKKIQHYVKAQCKLAKLEKMRRKWFFAEHRNHSQFVEHLDIPNSSVQKLADGQDDSLEELANLLSCQANAYQHRPRFFGLCKKRQDQVTKLKLVLSHQNEGGNDAEIEMKDIVKQLVDIQLTHNNPYWNSRLVIELLTAIILSNKVTSFENELMGHTRAKQDIGSTLGEREFQTAKHRLLKSISPMSTLRVSCH